MQQQRLMRTVLNDRVEKLVVNSTESSNPTVAAVVDSQLPSIIQQFSQPKISEASRGDAKFDKRISMEREMREHMDMHRTMVVHAAFASLKLCSEIIYFHFS